ncbi:MAG: ISAs1 family transposase [Streptosporangiales bacterium]|nr:ISAs1 family transposase [Streptosporangiales bacterium]
MPDHQRNHARRVIIADRSHDRPLARRVESVDADRATVLSVLAPVADPRARRGIRHGLSTILTVAVCAVLAGARSFAAIAEWAADTDAEVRERIAGVVPCESTIRRTLQRLDADAFDDRIGAWAQQCTTPSPGSRRLVAVDGKTLRGSSSPDLPGRHLLSALDHTHGMVLGQVDVVANTDEIPMFATLLDRIELSGAVVTADTMHAQRAHATYLVDQRLQVPVPGAEDQYDRIGTANPGKATGLRLSGDAPKSSARTTVCPRVVAPDLAALRSGSYPAIKELKKTFIVPLSG